MGETGVPERRPDGQDEACEIQADPAGGSAPARVEMLNTTQPAGDATTSTRPTRRGDNAAADDLTGGADGRGHGRNDGMVDLTRRIRNGRDFDGWRRTDAMGRGRKERGEENEGDGDGEELRKRTGREREMGWKGDNHYQI
jgi:hypothetical protein